MPEKQLQEIVYELLDDAQNLFGRMLDDWTFYGIEINNMPPCLVYYPDTGHITVSLSKKVISDEKQLLFQLSHEICHLLHPSRERESPILYNTLVINEGISTYFSVFKIGQYFDCEEDLINNLKYYYKDYYFAYTCVKDLLQIDPDAIKILRKKVPRVDKLTESDFDILPHTVPKELIENLLLPFSSITTSI